MKNPIRWLQKIKNTIRLLHLVHWLVILLSLSLTFFAWWYAKTQVESKVQLQFNKQANTIVHLIVEKMQKYEDALWGGVAYIYANNNDVSYNQWQSWSSPKVAVNFNSPTCLPISL